MTQIETAFPTSVWCTLLRILESPRCEHVGGHLCCTHFRKGVKRSARREQKTEPGQLGVGVCGRLYKTFLLDRIVCRIGVVGRHAMRPKPRQIDLLIMWPIAWLHRFRARESIACVALLHVCLRCMFARDPEWDRELHIYIYHFFTCVFVASHFDSSLRFRWAPVGNRYIHQ